MCNNIKLNININYSIICVLIKNNNSDIEIKIAEMIHLWSKYQNQDISVSFKVDDVLYFNSWKC